MDSQRHMSPGITVTSLLFSQLFDGSTPMTSSVAARNGATFLTDPLGLNQRARGSGAEPAMATILMASRRSAAPPPTIRFQYTGRENDGSDSVRR